MSWRYIAVTEIHRDNLPGFGNMANHRHKPPVLLVGPLRIRFMCHDFRSINVQRDFFTTVQSGLQQRLIDLNPSITHLWLTPHSSEPVTECRRLGESVEIQHATQRLITLKMTNIIQMKASFVLHQNECLEEF